jgi:hypothetical protein
VQSKRVVIDANILVRAVLGVRVRELIERYCDSVAFCFIARHSISQTDQPLFQ